MITIEDGNIVPNTVSDNITAAFNALKVQFSGISRTQFEGSKEYELAYMMAQLDASNALALQAALETNLNASKILAEQFNLSDCLQSRFQDVMEENGFIAAQKTPCDAGYMNVAISLTKVDGTDLDTTEGSEDFYNIVNLLGSKMLTNGILFANDAGVPDARESSYLSGNNSVPVKWTFGNLDADKEAIYFKVTIKALSTAPIGYGPAIRAIILENWNTYNRIGGEIVPQLYLPISSVEWAKSVDIQFSIQPQGTDITTITDWSGDVLSINYWDEYKLTASDSYMQVNLAS